MLSGIRLSLLATAISTLTACAVGPDYHAPAQLGQVTLPTHFEQATQSLNWWQAFDDPTLNQLIERALQENRTLVQARANVDRAYAVFRDNNNDRFPKGTLDTSYEAGKNTSLDPADDDLVSRGYQSGANLSWDLDLFGRIQRAQEAARADAQQAEFLWQDAQLHIITQVADTYGAVRGMRLRLRVARENVDILRQSRAIVQARLNAGTESELELARMDAQLREIEAGIPAFDAELTTALATLASLLATTPDALDLGQQEALPALSTPVTIVDGKNYLQYRADIASKERELAAASARIGVATADLYPDLSITGFLGFLSSPGNTLSAATESWAVAPSLQWQLMDLGSVHARMDAAEASSRMVLAEFEQSIYEGLNDMSRSLQNYNYSRRQELLTEQQYTASEKAVEIARKRYDAGSGEFLDFLDAQRELLRSRDQMVVLEQQTYSRLVTIYQSFGGAITLL